MNRAFSTREKVLLVILALPPGLFSCLQQPLSESPKLPAPRADVFAKGRTRPLGFLLL